MSINKSCLLLGYSKQAYFKSRNSERSRMEKKNATTELIIEKVDGLRELMPKIGGLKLFDIISPTLRNAGLGMGRDRFMAILKKHNKLVVRKKKYYRTTDSNAWRKQYPNLTIGVVPCRPEQIWVADITYFRTKKEGAVYGHLITDAYSKKIMGYHVSLDMKASSSVESLNFALGNRFYNGVLIHHSDRGSQYCSAEYTDILKEHNVGISMTQNGSPYDNAVAERVNGILKQEFGLGEMLDDLESVRETINRSVKIYNNIRPHWSNHLLTPDKMHQQQELKIRTWRKKKKDGG